MNKFFEHVLLALASIAGVVIFAAVAYGVVHTIVGWVL